MKRMLSAILALCLAAALFSGAAIAADTEGYSVTEEAAKGIYPYGATIFAKMTLPSGVASARTFLYYGTDSALSKAACISFTENNNGQIGMTVDSLLPDTDYYYQYKIRADDNPSDPVLAAGTIHTFHTPAVPTEAPVISSDANNPTSATLQNDGDTAYFKLTPAVPSILTATVRASSADCFQNDAVHLGAFDPVNYHGMNQSGNTSDSSREYQSINCLYTGTNYLYFYAPAGSYQISVSYSPLTSLQSGGSVSTDFPYTSFTPDAEGTYTFTYGGTVSNMALFNSDGSYIVYAQGSTLSAYLDKNQSVVLQCFATGSPLSVTGVLAQESLFVCDERGTSSSSSSYHLPDLEPHSLSFRYGTPKHFISLEPSTIKLTPSQGLRIFTTDQDAKNDTFTLYPDGFGPYTLGISGTGTDGTSYSGTLQIAPPSMGLSSASGVTPDSIQSQEYAFSGSSGTLYFYDSSNGSQSEMDACTFEISADNNTWTPLTSNTVSDGNGKYERKADIPATANGGAGYLRVQNASGITLASIVYRSLDSGPCVKIYTDAACTQPFTGSLALDDTPKTLYFVSSQNALHPLNSIGPTTEDTRWAAVSWGKYDTATGVQPLNIGSWSYVAGPWHLRLTANLKGAVTQNLTIPISTTTSGLYFQAVNTGEVTMSPSVTDQNVDGNPYVLQVMSNGQPLKDFRISGLDPEQKVATITQDTTDPSLLKFTYLLPGTTSFTVFNNNSGIGWSVHVCCYKHVTPSSWETDANNAIRAANDKDVLLTLDQDIELASCLNIFHANVTLDLNGHTLSYMGADNMISVDPWGKLTIRDSSSDKTGKIDANGLGTTLYVFSTASISNYNGDFSGGVITLENGTVTGYFAASIQAGAKLIVKGGKITNRQYAFCVTNYGALIMTGGTIENEKCGATVMCFNTRRDDLYPELNGYVEMTTEEKLTAKAGLASLMAETEGPSIIGSGNAISAEGGITHISAGTVQATAENGAAINSSGKVIIDGGTIIGTTGVKLTQKINEDDQFVTTGTLQATGGTMQTTTPVETDNQDAVSSITSSVSGIDITPKITVSGQTAALTVASNSDWTTAQILCVSYDVSGRMISVDKTVSGIQKGTNTISFTLPAGAKSAKAFILNSDSSSPFAPAAVWTVPTT
jgi:hypothetical protein